MINNNNKAFSLLIAMFLMVVMSLLSLYLLEYIIPFSRNTKWMENWTKAYYEANKWIEEVLFSMKWEDPYYETWITIPNTKLWHYYSLVSTWNTIPIAWDWNSEFDKDYNKISISNPVQLLLKWNIPLPTWANVELYFKVPHFDDSTSLPISLTWSTDPIINWQLSSEVETLNATWSHIKYKEVNPSIWPINDLNPIFGNRDWFTLSWTIKSISNFYTDPNNNCVSSWCVLKLSVVNQLNTANSKKIPYLEYKIVFPSWINVANYYAKISTSWKSTWYRKDLKLYIPQQTTIEAFDFTVFQ